MRDKGLDTCLPNHVIFWRLINEVAAPRIKYSLGIAQYEERFSRQAGRGRCSVDLGRFSAYLAHKYAYMRAVDAAYAHPVWNKLQWRGFIRKDQTRNRIVNEFADHVGADAVIGVGDWSHKSRVHLKNGAATIGVGLLRLLRSRFEHVYLIDEYKTSVSCSACRPSESGVSFSFRRLRVPVELSVG